MTGKKTLILGNGFDLNLGLRTSYSHFLGTLDKNDSDLIYCLHEKSNSTNQRWVDIEKELERLVISQPLIEKNVDEIITSKPFKLMRREYDSLRHLLKCYLIEQRLNRNNDISNTSAYKLLHKLFNIENLQLTIINFNYTDTIDDLLQIINEKNPTIDISKNIRYYKRYYHHIHGDLKVEKNIVFGIDDKADIPDEYNYLLKAFDRNASSLNINKILFESDEIYFFGYSLGETDTSYFDDFFKKLCEFNSLDDNDKKILNFYYYKDQGYKETISRIIHLTNRNLTKIKQYNVLNFFDCDLNEY